MINTVKRFLIKEKVLFLLLLVGFLFRLLPIMSVEYYINGEEAGLANSVLQFHGYVNFNSIDPIGRGYLHGFHQYLFFLSAFIFEPNLHWLKLSTISFNLMFILSFIPALRYVKKKLKSRNDFYQYLLIGLLVIPPFLILIWSSKARIEFLETLYIGNLILAGTLYLSEHLNNSNSLFRHKRQIGLLLVSLGIASGLSFLSQPLIIFYLGPSYLFIMTRILLRKTTLVNRVGEVFVFFSVLFLAATISIVLFDLTSNRVDLVRTTSFVQMRFDDGLLTYPSERLTRLITHINPTLFGSMDIFQSDHLFSPYYSALISVFILISISFSVCVSYGKLRRRIADHDVLIFYGIFFGLLIVYFSDFLNVVSETRRYLAFFSYYYLAIASMGHYLSALKPRKRAFLFTLQGLIVMMIVVNLYVGISQTYFKGLEAHYHPSYSDTIKDLNDLNVKMILTNSWIGGPITFYTKGEIVWTRSNLSSTPSSAGYDLNASIDKYALVTFANDNYYNSQLKELCRNFKKNELTVIYYDLQDCFITVEDKIDYFNGDVISKDHMIRESVSGQ